MTKILKGKGLRDQISESNTLYTDWSKESIKKQGEEMLKEWRKQGYSVGIIDFLGK